MNRLTDDERMLLRVLAAAEKPIRLQDVMQRLMPSMPDGTGWGGQRWWERQWCATAKNWIDLRGAGMFEPTLVVADDSPGRFGYVLTEVGRTALKDAMTNA